MINNKEIITSIFSVLNESGLDYCVQNKYEMMPEEIPSDIDIMVRNTSEKRLDEIVIKVANITNLLITQKIVQDYEEYTYILSPCSPKERFQLQLDFYKVISKGNTHNVLIGKDLLEKKQQYKNFFIPSNYDEIRYIFVRRTLKKDLDEEHLKKIQGLYSNEFKQQLINDFGDEVTNVIMRIIEETDISLFYDNYDLFQSAIKKLSRKNYKLKDKLKYFLFKVRKYPFKRILHPCGMSVAFLAPDGTGKSTVISAIKNTCSGSFYGVETFYFRPRLLKNAGHYNMVNPSEEATTNNNPHEVKINGVVKSTIRFLFYNIDFLFGTMFKINNLKIKKKLVVFDRYYYDYYADMKRYQYCFKPKMARIFRFFIPTPDLVIILDADAKVIVDRKNELTLEEVEEQRIAFKQVLKDVKKSRIINTEKDIDSVISEVTELILTQQANRVKKILHY